MQLSPLPVTLKGKVAKANFFHILFFLTTFSSLWGVSPLQPGVLTIEKA